MAKYTGREKKSEHEIIPDSYKEKEPPVKELEKRKLEFRGKQPPL